MADYNQAVYRLVIDPDTKLVAPYGYIRRSEAEDWCLIVPGPAHGHLGAYGSTPRITEIVYEPNRPFPREPGRQGAEVHYYGTGKV